jgi:hypothetical protein
METLPNLTPSQNRIVTQPAAAKIYLEGPAGCGKTTVGVARLLHLISTDVPAEQILVLLPQRTLAEPYASALRQADLPPGGMPDILTLGGLAQRMDSLFWPAVAAHAGFKNPTQPPVFLTLETAQYFLAQLIQPLLEKGYFGSITIDRSRLYSQILDNLNKAAFTGIAIEEVAERLKNAWVGDSAQLRVFDQVQECLLLFRRYCLEHNLLDFSLQVDLFTRVLWPSLLCRQYLQRTYRHLIFDNAEEDTPAAHDLVSEWLPVLDSALIVCDHAAGYRRFLGADPEDVLRLRQTCGRKELLTESFTLNPPLLDFAIHTGVMLDRSDLPPAVPFTPGPLADTMELGSQRFFPQLLDWTAARIAHLVQDEQVPPEQIVVLAPFMNDLLRHSLIERLQKLEIPAVTHRPSRSLRDEPVCRCLLTLAELAHPQWGIFPPKEDIVSMLVQAIAGLDPIRAQLLVDVLYRRQENIWRLCSFDQIIPEMQERITFVFGGRYTGLLKWLSDYQSAEPVELDYFFSRLFEQVLSQPGYGLHKDIQAGIQTANLIESVQKFRRVAGSSAVEGSVPTGALFVRMVDEGILAAQYLRGWQEPQRDAVLLAPATTFLMLNRPVDYQFWLDAGSSGWFERVEQPLTQPYVLSREWQPGAAWTDLVEQDANKETLYRLVLGLVRRCRKKVFIGLTELNEQGYPQDGMLLNVIVRYLKHLPPELRILAGGGADEA